MATKTILIVDDDNSIRNHLARLLTRAGYRIVQSGNGFVALDLLERSAEPPALILLDLRMPIMDGWKFRERQRENPRLAQIPVVVITSTKMTEADMAPIQAAAYLKKPIEAALLIKTIREHLATDTEAKLPGPGC